MRQAAARPRLVPCQPTARESSAHRRWALAASTILVACQVAAGSSLAAEVADDDPQVRLARPGDLTLAQVLARHTAAMGGRELQERIAAVRMRLVIEEGGQRLTADYVADVRQPAAAAGAALPAGQDAKAVGAARSAATGRDPGATAAPLAGRMRIDVHIANERVFSEGFDGAAGWSWPGGAPHASVASAPAAAALRRGIELPGKIFGLHELEGRGHHLDLVGFAEEDRFAVLALSLADGFSTQYWLDTGTWLIARRRDRRPLHVDVDPRPVLIETQFSDYRPVAGVSFAHRSREVELPAGGLLAETTVTAIEINPPTEPTSFTRP